MILQWVMSNAECDGIRYFSTRFTPDPEAIWGTANYVFPAINDYSAPTGYSQRLKDAFELTDPVIWGPVKYSDLREEARGKESKLNASRQGQFDDGVALGWRPSRPASTETMECTSFSMPAILRRPIPKL